MMLFVKFLVFLIYLNICKCHENIDVTEMKINEDIISKRVEKDIELSKPKINLCCEKDEIYKKRKCNKMNSLKDMNFKSFIFPKIYFNKTTVSQLDPWLNFDVKKNNPCNDDVYKLDEGSGEFYLFENGTVIIFENNNPPKIKSHNAFCITNLYDTEKNVSLTAIAVCFEPQTDDVLEKFNISIPLAMIMSIIFLIMTFFVYSVLPELRNIHGKTVMSYSACLCISYLTIVIVQFGGKYVFDNIIFCKINAFSIYFSFLASFFWLNVMCFDIWWTFGGLRSLPGSVKQREKKKFIYYSLYAWGLASILTGICLIADLVPGLPNYLIKPKFGNQKCWFVDEVSKAVYFYGPMGITVICNIILFISTALKIRQHKKNTSKQLGGMDSRRHDANKQWFNLYLKLFIVMGINWSMEIISWMEKGKEYLGTLYFIFDLANALQGVIIFIIFVWKDKIKRSLLKKIGWNDKLNSQSHTSTRNHSSSSRTTTTMLPLQDKTIKINNNKEQLNCLTTDESDCL
ncbi:G-protein coupled receptor Mth2-like isoform X4 [Aphidius gifuensis]|uniref:G-protein coupled receptor Mth2-like isoform X4 n=1 Tax=Aphidius gifuensis TaxID=684658 RepID=UPI001CDB5002|nr:G-protein coupled receptor Mth2-like isoform X4 [Aphidius gifuensis]